MVLRRRKSHPPGSHAGDHGITARHEPIACAESPPSSAQSEAALRTFREPSPAHVFQVSGVAVELVRGFLEESQLPVRSGASTRVPPDFDGVNPRRRPTIRCSGCRTRKARWCRLRRSFFLGPSGRKSNGRDMDPRRTTRLATFGRLCRRLSPPPVSSHEARAAPRWCRGHNACPPSPAHLDADLMEMTSRS